MQAGGWISGRHQRRGGHLDERVQARRPCYQGDSLRPQRPLLRPPHWHRVLDQAWPAGQGLAQRQAQIYGKGGGEREAQTERIWLDDKGRWSHDGRGKVHRAEPTFFTSYSNSSESDSDNETEDANGFVIIPKWKDFTTLDGPSYPRDQTKITRYHFSK